MRQIYYSIRTLLRERGSNLIRVISLSLGLTIGILLFSQIVFELSYENCYPEAERLAMVRAQITNLSTGEIMGDDGTNYDYTVFAPTANAVAGSMQVVFFRRESIIFIMKRSCCRMWIISMWIVAFFKFSVSPC